MLSLQSLQIRRNHNRLKSLSLVFSAAPSIPLITALQDLGATVQACDPVSMDQAKLELPDITYCDSPYSCATRADALVIVTEWEQFCALDLTRLKNEMAQPV